MRVYYIYKIICLCGSFKNHYYIGKRTSTKKDVLNDFYYGSGEKLRRYYKKYPPVLGETILKEIIEFNPDAETNSKREKEIIGDLYKTDPLCLNLMEGGNGRRVAKETTEKKSSLMKGKKLSDETKKKMSEARIRDNSYLSLKKYYQTHDAWNKGKIGLYGKQVACYNLDGEFLKIYDTITLAEKENNISEGSINICITKPNEHYRAGNFMWTPVFEEQPMKIKSYKDLQNEKYKKKSRKISQYTKDGKLVKIWDSVSDVSKHFGYKSLGVMYKLIDNPSFKNNNGNNIYNYIWKSAV